MKTSVTCIFTNPPFQITKRKKREVELAAVIQVIIFARTQHATLWTYKRSIPSLEHSVVDHWRRGGNGIESVSEGFPTYSKTRFTGSKPLPSAFILVQTVCPHERQIMKSR